MNDRNHQNPHDDKLSRRHFLAAAGAGGLLLLSGALGSAGDDAQAAPKFLLEWGHHGKEPGEFDACVGIAIGTNDEVHTCEFRNQRVQRFTSEGKFLGAFPVPQHSTGIAVDPAGNVYVSHWNSHKLTAWDPAGKLLREWGQKGTGDGEFGSPGSVAFGPDGLLYVPDQGNSRVQKFTLDGKFVGKFGEHGQEPGQFGGGQPVGGRFAGPQFVAFDRAGNVYTTDAALDRVQKFTPDGKLMAHWGSDSAERGGFGPPPLNKDGKPGPGGPISLCVDQQDRVWVSATNNRVQQFTNDGKYLRGMGGEGTEASQFELPHGVALDSQGHLYVVDTMNFRIQKFAAG